MPTTCGKKQLGAKGLAPSVEIAIRPTAGGKPSTAHIVPPEQAEKQTIPHHFPALDQETLAQPTGGIAETFPLMFQQFFHQRGQHIGMAAVGLI